jgi:F0F1-type ATP synthase assembly protein I
VTPRSSASPERRPRGGVALAGTIGGYFALCIFGGLGIGIGLDHLLRTSPLFLICGVVVGFVVGFILVYRIAMGELDT